MQLSKYGATFENNIMQLRKGVYFLGTCIMNSEKLWVLWPGHALVVGKVASFWHAIIKACSASRRTDCIQVISLWSKHLSDHFSRRIKCSFETEICHTYPKIPLQIFGKFIYTLFLIWRESVDIPLQYSPWDIFVSVWLISNLCSGNSCQGLLFRVPYTVIIQISSQYQCRLGKNTPEGVLAKLLLATNNLAVPNVILTIPQVRLIEKSTQ